MENMKVPLKELWPVMKEQIDAGKTVIFSPKGTSMLPLIRQDLDRIAIKKAPRKLKKYDLPLYLRENGQFVLHRVVGVKKDGYVMCGDNQFQREQGIADKQILALACGIYRGDDYLSLDSKKYKFYCKKQVAKMRIYGIYIALRRPLGKLKRKIIKK